MKRQAMMVESISPGESDGRYAVTIAATTDIGDGNPLDIARLDLERYLKNPVVLWSHDAWTIPIGQTISLERTGEKLRAEFEFLPGDEFADRVRNAWDHGFLRAASIGWENSDGMRDVMLEWSIVNIPADPEALRSLRAIEGLINAPHPTRSQDGPEGLDTGDKDGAPSPPEAESEDQVMPDQTTVVETIPEETASDSGPDMQGRLTDALLGASVARAMDETKTRNAETGTDEDKREEPAGESETPDLADVVARAVNTALDARAAAEAKSKSEAEDADEAFRLAVAQRSQIIERAKPHLPEDFHPHAKSNAEIMRAALGDKATDGMSEDFMRGMLMGLSVAIDEDEEGEGEDPTSDTEPNSEGRRAAQEQRDKVKDATRERMEDIAFGPRTEPQKDYADWLGGAWKGDKQ